VPTSYVQSNHDLLAFAASGAVHYTGSSKSDDNTPDPINTTLWSLKLKILAHLRMNAQCGLTSVRTITYSLYVQLS
jgi:hypothetical protein